MIIVVLDHLNMEAVNMKKQNTKKTLKKINLDAFELRFSEEKLEIEAKSLQWKTVIGSMQDLYGYFLNLSNSEEGMERLEVRLRFMYFASMNSNFDPVIYAASNMFYDLLAVLGGDNVSDDQVDECMKLAGDTLKDYFKDVKGRLHAEPTDEEQAEALEDAKILTQLKEEE